MQKNYVPRPIKSEQQSGFSLIAVLLVLAVVTVLGVGGAQVALMAERTSRSDIDLQMAWQAAESALRDAEIDMTTGTRSYLFNGQHSPMFVSGCGTAGDSQGLCAATYSGKPMWQTVDLSTSDAAVPYGTFTDQPFASGQMGYRATKPPVYLIELIRDYSAADSSSMQMMYRVTAMGFGPRPEIQAVLQMIYKN